MDRFVSALLLFLTILGGFARGISAQEIQRVVVLGFDGVDAALVERWMESGDLPNLASLRERGDYAPLEPTNPAQTPVSWSSFATGRDPGDTQIFDFLRRIPATYYPDFALISEAKEDIGVAAIKRLTGRMPRRIFSGDPSFHPPDWLVPLLFWIVPSGGIAFCFLLLGLLRRWRPLRLIIVLFTIFFSIALPLFYGSRYLPTKLPVVSNNRNGDTLWGLLDQHGLKVHIFRVPATFPPQQLLHGEQVSGLGVPDIRGRVGTPSYYTTDPSFAPDSNKFSIELFRLSEWDEAWETSIYGPPNMIYVDDGGNPLEGYPRRIDIPFRFWKKGPSSVEIALQDQVQKIQAGAWSQWFSLTFRFNRWVSVEGFARFYLLSTEPYVRLYLSPVHWHPSNPPLPFTHPPSYAQELLNRFGYYKTMGWAIDTWSLDQEVLDEAAFLQDAYQTVETYETMLEAFLEEDNDLLIHVFNFPDRIGHLFWRLSDPAHPYHDEVLAARYGNAIKEAYQRVDSIVGRVANAIDEHTLLLVCSDHGFQSWRYAVNYNTWLALNGYMTLRSDIPGVSKNLEDLFGGGQFFENVDWSRTVAYALGLGNIYINLKDREPRGIVPSEEKRSIEEEIIQGLKEWVDPVTGVAPVYHVYRREEIYTDFDPAVTPDLRVTNNPPYRVSWQTSLGGVPKELISSNRQKWSGDHCSVDPRFVHGILFTNRKLTTHRPHIQDLFPSILTIFGISAPEGIDGHNVL